MNPIPIEIAAEYTRAGLSCLPAVRAQKRPSVGSWRTWGGRLPTDIEIMAWFSNRQDALCVVAGAVSGNLECIDFDNHGELFEPWMLKIDTALLGRLVIERSPSGGYHVVYRCESAVDGNLKLARGMRDGKIATLIETRGEGGLFLCAPTDGYELQQGEFTHIATITQAEREALLNAARELDEQCNAECGVRNAELGEAHGNLPIETQAHNNSQFSTLNSQFELRPGDDFAARADIRPFLAAAGWQSIGQKPDGNELWRRPGKTSGGHSATFDGKVFYVFSSNAAPFESGRGYNAFQVYTLLMHGGDFTASARALLAAGYGKREETAPTIDFSAFNATLAASMNNPIGCESVQTDHPVVPCDTPVTTVLGDQRPISIGRLVADYPKMRPVIIHGFLREGETMNIIAPPKTGKSWLVTDLALAVATGSPWFGYPCEAGKVLIIDNELHRETSAARIPKIVAARGFELKDVADSIFIINQRGALKTIEDIGNHLAEYREAGFKLIIIDAFYRAMPRGVDENDNGAVADVYNLLDRYAHEIGCAFVLIHHTSKGNQSLKAVTDVGSGAGSQSRAADTHVVLRRHKEPDAVVMESVVRSFPGVKPLCLKWNWPLWNPAPELNPDDLDGKAQPKMPKRGAEAASETVSLVERVPTLVDTANPIPKSAFVCRIQEMADCSRARARELFGQALDLGYIECAKAPSDGQRQNATMFVTLGKTKPEDNCEEYE